MKKIIKIIIFSIFILMLCSCSNTNINIKIQEDNSINFLMNYQIRNEDIEYYNEAINEYENMLSNCGITINKIQNDYYIKYEILENFDNINTFKSKLKECNIKSINIKEKSSKLKTKYTFNINIKADDIFFNKALVLNKSNPNPISNNITLGQLRVNYNKGFDSSNFPFANKDNTEISTNLEDIINNKEKFSYTVHNYNTIYILSGTIFALVVIIIIILFIKISIKKKKAYKKRDLREININLE